MLMACDFQMKKNLDEKSNQKINKNAGKNNEEFSEVLP